MKNKNGFTLIELLAVITIMGILMLVAIPAVSRTIENTRRQTFANMALQYIKAIKNEVSADQLSCGGKPISAVNNSYDSNSGYHTVYYYMFNSDGDSGKDLMEQGGKSAWGGSTVRGVISIYKTTDSNSRTKYEYGMMVTDSAGRGFGESSNYYNGYYRPYRFIVEKNINRSTVKTKNESNRLSFYNGYTESTNDSNNSAPRYNGYCQNFYFDGTDNYGSLGCNTYWTRCTLNS